MAHEKLIRSIQRHAQSAMNARQVSRRLEALLPLRLKEVERRFRGNIPAAEAHREALCDKTYLDFVEEYASIHGDAILGRVQYETHMMLFEARRSLRKRA
jgi:hypothetical protein